MENPFQKNSKVWKYFNICEIDESTGYSEIVSINKLEEVGLSMGNGGDWCRSDGSLGKLFNINRVKEKGKIIGVQLSGYKKNPFSNKIDQKIRSHYQSYDCVVLAVKGQYIEIDHKDGRKDDFGMPNDQQTSNFQPLHKNANIAKRQHCKECKVTNIRFDAKQLGYITSQWIGPIEYHGSCIGCYWYDPIEFNTQISKNYRKER